MTFTEAAVEVLRLAGKPLHYKKITELSIRKNLLSHVGKTPEITMSSRLATMVKKDRGDAPIIKVKPGVFALREFPAEVIEAAVHDPGQDFEVDEELLSEEPAEAAKAEAPDEPGSQPPPASGENGGNGHALPGAELFPEEEDDDEPILANLDAPEPADKKRRKRRRRRKRKGEGDAQSADETNESESKGPGNRRQPSREARGTRRQEEPSLARDESWRRSPAAGDLLGQDLADAVELSLGDGRTQSQSLETVAAALVRRGRLQGEPSSLVATVAAAVRGDIARRRAERMPPRFRMNQGRIELMSWALPNEASRALSDVFRSAQRQRDLVRRAFVRRLADLPAVGLMEILASWLNAEGVIALRAIRRPGTPSGEFHLAGVLRQGPQEIPVAIVFVREGNIGREKVVEARGALHHYGDARIAWLITLGQVLSGAQEESASIGAAPCALFDGMSLAEAMEKVGVGLVRYDLPVVALDLDALDGLGGTVGAERRNGNGSEGQERRNRRRRRDRRDENASSARDRTDAKARDAEDEDNTEERLDALSIEEDETRLHESSRTSDHGEVDEEEQEASHAAHERDDADRDEDDTEDDEFTSVAKDSDEDEDDENDEQDDESEDEDDDLSFDDEDEDDELDEDEDDDDELDEDDEDDEDKEDERF